MLVRFGEIFLKGENKGYFEKLLISNIEESLSGLGAKLKRIQGRFILSGYTDEVEDEIVFRLGKVFGIHSFSPAKRVKSDMGEIEAAAILLCEAGTFKVTTNRADKRFPMGSMDVSRLIGARILESVPGTSVDVHNPEQVISIDIREDGRAYLFGKTYAGERGLPYGCSGKGMLLLSGGIDSPVAGYTMARRGMTLSAVHFHSYPYTSEMAKEKVFKLSEELKAYLPGEFRLYLVPFTTIQEEINAHCPPSYMIAIMRRFMMRIASALAKREGAQALITGEALGQVASQTIESLGVTNAVAELPVLRPLIGADKLDIIALAEKIGTYRTSILPYEDCCTVFLPKNPVIKPKLELIEQSEAALDVQKLTEDALSGTEIKLFK